MNIHLLFICAINIYIYSLYIYIMNKTRKWSKKYKKNINCKRPKGFSQKQYCKYGRKKTKKLYKNK